MLGVCLPDHQRKYLDALNEEMGSVDALAQVILKGHLVIEGALDNILTLMLFHAEHLSDARLSFAQKVYITRGYALRKNTNSIWHLILEVNSLRNNIAHRLEGEKRHEKIARLRERCRSEFSPDVNQVVDGGPDEEAVALACALCLGFLADFEHDTRALRDYIDALDTVRNPERERMPQA